MRLRKAYPENPPTLVLGSVKGNPLANIVGNVLLELTKQFQPLQPDIIDGDVPELAEVPMVQRMLKEAGTVSVIIGGRTFGKSIAGYRLCEIFDRDTYAISPASPVPDGAIERKLDELDDMELVPPFSNLFCDDILTYLSVRDYMSPEVQVLEKIIPVARHMRALNLIFAAQVAGQADKWCLQADIILIKPPDNELFVDIERPGVKRLHLEAMPYWEGRSEDWIHRHIYVVSRLYKGLARVNMPTSFTFRPRWRFIEQDED